MTTSTKDINAFLLKATRDGLIERDMGAAILKQVNTKRRRTDVAIIGVECAFSQATTKEQFWANLVNGQTSIRTMPRSRANDVEDSLGISRSDEHALYSAMGYLPQIAEFDASFFRISPKEALVIDPKQRLFLQVLYRAFEDAGYGGGALHGTKTGVYVGVDHLNDTEFPYKALVKEPGMLSQTGAMPGLMAGRPSYLFDLSGPAVVFDTACSSSLVALHAACEGLYAGECDMAVAGGVNVSIYTRGGTNFQSVESGGGAVRTFDRRASGTNWGEGVAALVVKRLDDAIADGDHVYAVVKSVALNNDGATNGVTAPSSEAQERVIVQAWKDADIDAGQLSYIEAHGTGTTVGDRIEMRALTNAFERFTTKRQFCGLGTAKPNIGHAVAASGMAGLIKVILAMEHGTLPPSVNFEEPNPEIGFANSPMFMVDSPLPWPKGTARLAGVSSFGFSGTNSHAVLASPPVEGPPSAGDGLEVLTLSTHSRTLWPALLDAYLEALRTHPDSSLADLCFTANTGRRHSKWRVAVTASSIEDLVAALTDLRAQVSGGGDLGAEPRTEGRNEAFAEMSAAVERYRQSGRTDRAALNRVAELYRAGIDTDWRAFYAGSPRRRMALPASPLLPTRFWAEYSDQPTPTGAASLWQQTGRGRTARLVTATTDWSLVDGLQAPALEDLAGSWLVLGDAGPTAERVTAYLEEAGARVVAVTANDRGEYAGADDRYTLDPQRPQDIDLLAEDLKRSEAVPTHVVYLWSLDAPGGDLRNRPFDTLVALLRALSGLLGGRVAALTIVTSGAFGFDGRPEPSALIAGAAGVAAHEYPKIAIRHVDTELHGSAPTLAGRILAEAIRPAEPSPVLYRGDARLTRYFRSVELTDASGGSGLRAGVYLLTGGLGGIGEALAEHLLGTHQASVVLTGRTPLPDDAEWPTVSAATHGAEVAARVATMTALRRHGCPVEYHAVDLADVAGMSALVDEVESRLGAITGVFHLAGVASGRMIHFLTPGTSAPVLEPKVDGTLVLDQVFAGRDVEFVMLFSSVLAILGPTGSSEYAAACAFEDAYARAARVRYPRRRTISVNWDRWAHVGMAARSDAEAPAGSAAARMMADGLTLEDGIGLIDPLLRSALVNAAVTSQSIDEMRAVLEGSDDTVLGEGRGEPKFDRPELSVDYVAPRTDVEANMAAMWEGVFSIRGLGVNDSFYELGGDSLHAISLTSVLNQAYPVEVTDLYAYPTIAELAAYVGGMGRTGDLRDQLQEVGRWFTDGDWRQPDSPHVAGRRAAYAAQVPPGPALGADAVSYRDVLLLGATGFVGVHLLHEVLANTAANVHVLVRPGGAGPAERLRAAYTRFFSDEDFQRHEPRIHLVVGDAAQPQFGLAEQEYERLAGQIDGVLNSAGKVDHVGRRDDFVGPNVSAVRHVLEFAATGITKDVHHVSTRGVMGLMPGGHEIFTEFDDNLGQQPVNAYTDTKLEAELLLHEARRAGQVVTIYRLNAITGDSDTGTFQENIDQNAFYLQLRALYRFACLPQGDLRLWDFTPVDAASRRLVAMMGHRSLHGQTYHLLRPTKVGVPEFAAAFRAMGQEKSLVTVAEFMDYLAENYDGSPVTPFVREFVLHSKLVEIPQLAGYDIVTDWTHGVLEHLGMPFDADVERDVLTAVRYSRDCGFLDAQARPPGALAGAVPQPVS